MSCLHHFVNHWLIMNYSFVNPTIVVASPETHNSCGPIRSKQFSVDLHLEVTIDQVQIGTLLIICPSG